MRVEVPYNASVYVSPQDMLSSLTTLFIDAVDSGDSAKELVSLAKVDRIPSMYKVVVGRGYVVDASTGTEEEDIGKSTVDKTLYGLIVVATVPIAIIGYLCTQSQNVGVGIRKKCGKEEEDRYSQEM